MEEKKRIFNQFSIFKDFFENTIYPIAILDKDYNFICVNAAYADADAKDVSFFPGKNHFDLYPSDAKEFFDEVVRTKVPYQTFSNPFAYINNLERGTTYWDLSLVPVLDKETTEISFLIFSLYDVTERIRTSEIFSITFESSPLSMILINTDGYVIKANHSFLSLFGYKEQEVINKNIRNIELLVQLVDIDRIKEILNKDKELNNLELMFKNKNGDMKTGVFSLSIVNIKGENYYFCTINDISELKSIETEMQRLDKLNIIGEMAASIAHEVRNPMTSIKGFLQLFMNKYEFTKHKEHFALMIEELDRVNTLITEFLSLAKNKPISKKHHKLNEILQSLFPLLQAEAIKDNKDVHLELNKIPDLFIDENEIRQLVLNLCRNGLEAMSRGGILTIETIDTPKKIIMKIVDQGKGIPKDIINDIFSPFYTTKENGTGLGLAICLRIAERQNAQIKVSSDINGTTFYIAFNKELFCIY